MTEIIYTIDNIDITEYIPISLGYNCTPAIFRAENLNKKKETGYKTCPFDLGLTPFATICDILENDFDLVKFFNIKTEFCTYYKRDVIINEYSMYFNHETEPLYKEDGSLKWGDNNEPLWATSGKWKENNYILFKERYSARIQNFKDYLSSGRKILFIIKIGSKHHISKINDLIKIKYPLLDYKILVFNTSSMNNDNECGKGCVPGWCSKARKDLL